MILYSNYIAVGAFCLLGGAASVTANEFVEPSVISQVESIAQESTSIPEYLNPSSDPLVFPTKPEEVEIKSEVPITLKQAIELAQRNNKDLQVARLTLERSQELLGAALAEEWPTISTETTFSRDSSIQAEQQNEQTRQLVEQLRQLGIPPNLLDQIASLRVPENIIQQLIDLGVPANIIQQIRDVRVPDNIIQIARQLGLDFAEVPEESTNVNGELNLNYNLYTGGRRGATIRQTEKQVRIDELNVEITAAEVSFNTKQDYYDLQNADAQVEIEQAALNEANRSLRDAQLLRQEGLGTKLDVLQAEADVANANQRLVGAIARQQTAKRELAETIGVGQQVGLTTQDKIEVAGSWGLSLEESIILAIKNRAELEQQLLQREINQEQRKIELAAIKPQVSLFGNYNFTDNFDDSRTVADGYSLGTKLEWTAFDGGRARARARAASKNIQIAETNFAIQRDRIRLSIESAYYDLNANQENIQTAQVNIQRAEERLRLARLRFQAGVGTQTDVINAQRDLTQARGSYLQAIIGYNQSLNQLQRAVSNLPDNQLFKQQ